MVDENLSMNGVGVNDNADTRFGRVGPMWALVRGNPSRSRCYTTWFRMWFVIAGITRGMKTSIEISNGTWKFSSHLDPLSPSSASSSSRRLFSSRLQTGGALYRKNQLLTEFSRSKQCRNQIQGMLRSRRRWFHISPIFLSFSLFFLFVL